MQRVARPAFRRPYPDRVEREYERPRNYKVPDFSTFSGDDERQPMNIFLGLQFNVEKYQTMRMENL